MIPRTFVAIALLALAFQSIGCSQQTSRDMKRDVNEAAREIDHAFEK